MKVLIQRYDNEDDLRAIEGFGFSDTFKRSVDQTYDYVAIVPTRSAGTQFAVLARPTSQAYEITVPVQWPGRHDTYGWRIDLTDFRETTLEQIKQLAIQAGKTWAAQWEVMVADLDLTGIIADDEKDALTDIKEHEKEFETATETEREALRKSRVGQGIFRKKLLERWGGCSITDVRDSLLLRASHIKPWRDCSNSERLSTDNGLLLLPHYDHLFDKGLISFEDDGRIVISPQLGHEARQKLGISESLKLRWIPEGAKPFLEIHRSALV